MPGKVLGMSRSASIHLPIQQGATFRRVLTWGAYPYPVRQECGVVINAQTGRPANPADFVPVDLTGCTARMQIRAEVGSILPLLELSTTNGRIALGGTAGTATLSIDAATTAALTWDSGVWDLEITHPGGEVSRMAEGTASVSPEVTRGP